MIIKDLESLKLFLKQVKTPIFGVGVYAFHRLGLEDLIPNYRILALRYSLDTELIEKDIEVLSLEKGMGTRHIQEPRNATTVLKHESAKNYLKKFKNFTPHRTETSDEGPILIVYKTSSKMEKICQENGWILAQSPVKFGKRLFENKIKFREILEKIGVAVPPGEIIALSHAIKDLKENSTINPVRSKTPLASASPLARTSNGVNQLTVLFSELKFKYGLPFVIQHPTKGGGGGTFFISSWDSFLDALRRLRIRVKEGGEMEEETKKIEVIVAKYIKGPSPSITGCVTRHGILSTNPQHQILDSPSLYSPKRGSGLFCGHDWSYSRFPENIKNQAYEIIEKVGNYLKKFGYKGIFGLDFVLDENGEKLYVTECNPRFLGSLPTLTMIQLKNNEPPIVAFHLLEYLNIDYNIDLENINKLMRNNKEGAQMIMHNLSGRWARNHKEIPAGVYRLNVKCHGSNVKCNELRFVGPGYKLDHLKSEDEFLITEGVPFRKSHFSPNRRLIRIVTLRGVLKNYETLNHWAENIVRKVYESFDIKPIRFIKLRKLLDPYFLAKG